MEIESKKRHGCLTTWIVLMIAGGALSGIVYLFAPQTVLMTLPSAPKWIIPVLVVMTALNIVWSVALLKWKKWGFWGFCISAAVGVIFNLSIGLGLVQSLLGLVGVAILYGVLHIGGDNKAWPQLE